MAVTFDRAEACDMLRASMVATRRLQIQAYSPSPSNKTSQEKLSLKEKERSRSRPTAQKIKDARRASSFLIFFKYWSFRTKIDQKSGQKSKNTTVQRELGLQVRPVPHRNRTALQLKTTCKDHHTSLRKKDVEHL